MTSDSRRIFNNINADLCVAFTSSKKSCVVVIILTFDFALRTTL